MNNLKSKHAQYAWCLYDWGSSGWLLFISYIFSNYFTNVLASSPNKGTILWGNMLTVSGILIALICPVVGIITDESKSSLQYLKITTYLTCLCALAFWFATPSIHSFHFLLIAFIGMICKDLSTMFYFSFLSKVSNTKNIVKISSKGAGMGFMGGQICLILILTLFVNENYRFLNLDQSTYQHVRIAGPFLCLWLYFFSIPLFNLNYKKSSTDISLRKFTTAAKKAITNAQNLKNNHNTIFNFLVMRALHTDGL